MSRYYQPTRNVILALFGSYFSVNDVQKGTDAQCDPCSLWILCFFQGCSKETDAQCDPCSLWIFRFCHGCTKGTRTVDPDPHSFSLPDPHSICGSGSRRVNLSTKNCKNARKLLITATLKVNLHRLHCCCFRAIFYVFYNLKGVCHEIFDLQFFS